MESAATDADALRRLRSLKPDALLPGHGERIDDPARVIDWIIEHRLEREAKVVAALESHPDTTAAGLVPVVYRDVPEHLYGWAERSLLAHLIKLVEDERADVAEDRYRMRD